MKTYKTFILVFCVPLEYRASTNLPFTNNQDKYIGDLTNINTFHDRQK